MIRVFCDRCGQEVTGRLSSTVYGIANAATNGTGTVTDSFNIICRRCYRAWKAFMQPTATSLKARAKR